MEQTIMSPRRLLFEEALHHRLHICLLCWYSDTLQPIRRLSLVVEQCCPIQNLYLPLYVIAQTLNKCVNSWSKWKSQKCKLTWRKHEKCFSFCKSKTLLVSVWNANPVINSEKWQKQKIMNWNYGWDTHITNEN